MASKHGPSSLSCSSTVAKDLSFPTQDLVELVDSDTSLGTGVLARVCWLPSYYALSIGLSIHRH